MNCLPLCFVTGESNVLLLQFLASYVLFDELTKIYWEKSWFCVSRCFHCVAFDLGDLFKRIGIVMADGEENIELKFRIFDGTDIGHRTYGSSTTVADLKQRLVAEWPQGKSVTPKSVNDMKLIHAGKVLENSKTLSESRIHVGDLVGGVITMHVVVQPVVVKKKSDKDAKLKQNSCSCSIL